MNENNRAIPFCIRLADTVIRIEPMFEYIREYCRDYITEEQENQEQLTESGILQKEENRETDKISRYQMINEMAIGETLQDYDTVYQILEEYWRTEFVVDKVFHL